MSGGSQKISGPGEVFDVDRMRACSSLLPEPGDAIVRECLDEIVRLRALIESPNLAKDAKLYVQVDDRFLVSYLALEPGNEPIRLDVRMSMNEMIKVAKERHRLFRIASVDWSSDTMTTVIRLEPDIGIRFLNGLPLDIKVIDKEATVVEIQPAEIGPLVMTDQVHCNACGSPAKKYSVHLGMVFCDVCIPIAEPKPPFSFGDVKFEDGGDVDGDDGN